MEEPQEREGRDRQASGMNIKAVKEKNQAWRKWWKSKLGEDKEDYIVKRESVGE